jgi:hypothetical protein
MAAPVTRIPIQHNQAIHEVSTAKESKEERRAPRQLTLLELVETIAEVTEDEREIVATVVHMLASGQVCLAGNFRQEPIELLLRDVGVSIAHS